MNCKSFSWKTVVQWPIVRPQPGDVHLIDPGDKWSSFFFYLVEDITIYTSWCKLTVPCWPPELVVASPKVLPPTVTVQTDQFWLINIHTYIQFHITLDFSRPWTILGRPQCIISGFDRAWSFNGRNGSGLQIDQMPKKPLILVIVWCGLIMPAFGQLGESSVLSSAILACLEEFECLYSSTKTIVN